jgi:perosamine synthetase
LIDIHPETLTIDPLQIEEKITENTKAIIVVHQFGHAAHMDEINALAKKYNLKIIEDNAESIGGKYKSKLLGTIGDISCFSFFGNKIITTGEGGAVLTNDENTAIKCRELRDHGMSHKKKYHQTDLGYNYRMTNMQAAIGLAQIEKLDEILELRRQQMDYYYNELCNMKGMALRKFADWCEPVHWMMTLILDENYNRDDLLSFMKENRIDCRQMINPIYQADHLKNQFKEKFSVATSISRQSIHLPSGTVINKSLIDLIVSRLITWESNYDKT